MNYDEFLAWLQEDKNLSLRSARDVVSRNKRALTITNQKCLDKETLQILVKSNDFLSCSISIKSQIKRAVTLYMEFAHIN